MAHETIECDLQNKSEEFIDVYKRANPGGRAKVPVLEIDGETLVESSVTVEYLAERAGAVNSDAESRMQEMMDDKHAQAHVADVRVKRADSKYVAKLLLEAAKELDLLAFD